MLVIKRENKNPTIYFLNVLSFLNLTKSLSALAGCVHFYLAIPFRGTP